MKFEWTKTKTKLILNDAETGEKIATLKVNYNLHCYELDSKWLTSTSSISISNNIETVKKAALKELINTCESQRKSYDQKITALYKLHKNK